MLPTSVVSDRPYINFYHTELKKILLVNWDEPDILLAIKLELHFRQKKKSIIYLIDQIEKRLGELSFSWVSTTVDFGDGSLEIIDWNKTGLLSAVGYETGINGLNPNARRNILENIYLLEIPKYSKILDLEKWGKPRTCQRLKKLADCLASFTRNEKRNYRGDYSISIAERESDLKYLKKKFYDGRYDFRFPSTEI